MPAALRALLWGERVAPALGGDYVSSNLSRLRARLQSRSKPYVLDLGPMSAPSLRQLLALGCHLHCEHPTEPGAAPDDSYDPAAALWKYRFPSAFFDAVLLWDLYDYLPAPAALRFSGNLRAMLAPGGLIHALLRPKSGAKRAHIHRFELEPEPGRFSAAELEPTLACYPHAELRPLFPGLRLLHRQHHPGGLRDLLLGL